MLVLARKRDEQIVIGDDIVITVVDFKGFKVRLGIDAPAEVEVHRREVWQANRPEGALPGPNGSRSLTCPECGYAPEGRICYWNGQRHVCGFCLQASHERLLNSQFVTPPEPPTTPALGVTRAALPDWTDPDNQE
jgi:carbon storage regulator